MRMVVVSSAPSAAHAGGMRTRPAAPAIDKVVRNRRRDCFIGIETSHPSVSRLQLAFELVEEAPIGVFGENVIRAQLDQTRFVKAQ